MTGEICPVGPTSFEFVVPEGVPLTISPAVGTIEPGKVSWGLPVFGGVGGGLGHPCYCCFSPNFVANMVLNVHRNHKAY